jgi:hypothetical protein
MESLGRLLCLLIFCPVAGGVTALKNIGKKVDAQPELS